MTQDEAQRVVDALLQAGVDAYVAESDQEGTWFVLFYQVTDWPDEDGTVERVGEWQTIFGGA